MVLSDASNPRWFINYYENNLGTLFAQCPDYVLPFSHLTFLHKLAVWGIFSCRRLIFLSFPCTVYLWSTNQANDTQRKPTATQALFALSCTTSTPPPVMLIISRKQLAAGHIRRMNIGLRCTETTQHTRWDNVDDIYAISCVCHRACTKKSRFH